MRLWFAVFLCLLTTPAQATCRQALAFGLDVSASVDAREYRLQLDGLASALLSPAVQDRIFAMPQAPVALAAFEWSGMRHHRDISGWQLIETQADLVAFANRLRAHQRVRAASATAIGAAMSYGGRLLVSGPECWRRTLDLSGDGTNNDGTPPPQLHARMAQAGITVNGLIIGSDRQRGYDARQMEIMELSAYYRRRVIFGPGAFIEVAIDFADYENAMRRKLLRELSGFVMGALSVE
ncbi:MAG: DUF1194 domain-containing protein [Pseudomonadota bacterium]